VAYGSLKPSEAQQASGLINLSRQIGGSFGIAILINYVTTHTQLHRNDLIANVYSNNPALIARQHMMTANLIAHGYSPVTAKSGALAVIDQMMMRQAAMLSYNDAWLFILLVFVAVSPAILLLRKPQGTSGSVDAH
jgi:DHA2 family multidrug resistance protein